MAVLASEIHENRKFDAFFNADSGIPVSENCGNRKIDARSERNQRLIHWKLRKNKKISAWFGRNLRKKPLLRHLEQMKSMQ